jgi:hypothetical protein
MSDNLHRVIEDRRDTNSSSWTRFGLCDRSIDRHSTQRLGGARRDRTDDLLLAKQALSQLSYGPGYDARFENGGPGKTRTSDLTLIKRAL